MKERFDVRVIKIYLFIICITVSSYVIANDLLEHVANSSYTSCKKAYPNSGVFSYVKQEIYNQRCMCMSERLAQYLSTDKNYKNAFERNDEVELRRLSNNALMIKKYELHKKCYGEIIKNNNDVIAILDDEKKKNISKKKGLRGKLKEQYLVTNVSGCMTNFKDVPNKEAICNCLANAEVENQTEFDVIISGIYGELSNGYINSVDKSLQKCTSK